MQTTSLGRLIPLSAISPSSTNPRKRFNESDLAELANSIKQHGIMQPILVRPINVEAVTNGSAPFYEYQIVAGERRYRASKLAGMESIPAIERVLDDLETLQLQIIENLQRSDLHPLEEAQGFKALLDNKDAKSWDADELAAKIGKSRSYIYGSLKLNELCTYAQDQFLDNKFGREIALLIARIPGAKLQEQAAKDIINGEHSFRRAKEYVRSTFTLDLSKAPWDKLSTTLYPNAGSCFSCPKRTGNYPELFQDIESADVCTDTACFAAKKVAYGKEFIATQPRVIFGEEVKAIAPFGVNQYITNGYTSSIEHLSHEGFKAADLMMDEAELPAPYQLIDDKNDIKPIFKITEVQSAIKQKLAEKLASGELVLPEKVKSAYQIKQETLQTLQAIETERRLHIFNRLVPHLTQSHLNLILRVAIDGLARGSSTDFQPVMDQYAFEGTEEEFFTDFQRNEQNLASLTKMLAMLLLAPGCEVSTWQWKTEADNENDTDYQALLTFIGNIGLDVSQFLTAELPPPPPLAAQAVEITPEPATPAIAETQLPSKLQEIKEKELAKRAKKAQKQEQKESANADLNTQALTESAQTSGASESAEAEA